jgi:alpha-glucosidase
MTEAYVGNDELMEYYGQVDQSNGIGDISHMPINFGLVSSKCQSAEQVKRVLEEYLNVCSTLGAWPNFSLGNHDSPRGTTRFGSPKLASAMNALLMLLPGTPLTYYGEDIGMLDNDPGDK